MRSGPDAIAWGSAWDAICFVDNTQAVAVIEGYCGRGKYTKARRNTIVELVNRETGKEVTWDRRKRNEPLRTLVQLPRGAEGRIRMAKKLKIPDIAGAFNKDGSVNWPDMRKALAIVESQENSGHYKISGSASQTANADGSTSLQVNMTRTETNPKEAAA